MQLKNLQRHEIKHLPDEFIQEEEDPVRKLDLQEETKEMKPVVYGIFIVLLLLGIVTGFVLSRRSTGFSTVAHNVVEPEDGKTAVGVSDKQTFKDSATGVIEIGGFEGEGTHKLIRDGGPSQTVYLVSSVVDLDQFAGKSVTIWGQTFKSTKAGWFMDVGKVEI